MNNTEARVREADDPSRVGRVLVVDDDPTCAEIATVVLEGAGFEVEYVDSAERCLERVVQDEFDAVLTDIRMGAMDGLELTGRLRLLVPETRVVVMTANDDYDTVRAALTAGAYDYLDKPLNRHALLVVTLSHAVRAARAQRRDSAERRALLERVTELEASEARLHALVDTLRAALHVDERTGLASRHGIRELLGRALRERGDDAPLAVALVELDGNGRTPETRGDAGADAALARLAGVLRSVAPGVTLVGHEGDGRFAVVLPGASPKVAAGWADALTSAARATASDVRIGLAYLEPGDVSPDAAAALARAAEALRSGTGTATATATAAQAPPPPGPDAGPPATDVAEEHDRAA